MQKERSVRSSKRPASKMNVHGGANLLKIVQSPRLPESWRTVISAIPNGEIMKHTKICNPGVCDNCQYICEGDFWCDLTDVIVISGWEPTDDYMACERR